MKPMPENLSLAPCLFPPLTFQTHFCAFRGYKQRKIAFLFNLKENFFSQLHDVAKLWYTSEAGSDFKNNNNNK